MEINEAKPFTVQLPTTKNEKANSVIEQINNGDISISVSDSA